VAPCF